RGVKGEKKFVWVIVILLFSTIGPVLYLVAGKKDFIQDEDH
ncbi:PLD nuclease N-terminal domain-containing protein, partial [Pradoshia sp.]